MGQLTVSASKVAAAKTWITQPSDVVVCCCRIDDEVMIVDGHSRAAAAWELELAEVGVVFDEVAPLQHQTRRWCRAAGVTTVADLALRVVDQKTHEEVWIRRCQDWLPRQKLTLSRRPVMMPGA